jgi:hypothetical protein
MRGEETNVTDQKESATVEKGRQSSNLPLTELDRSVDTSNQETDTCET